jgi:hypothetical protein
VKFDPLSRVLYTDRGELIKRLSCDVPRAKRQLTAAGEAGTFRCSACSKQVKGTAGLTDEAVVELMRRQPDACLRVDLVQDNVRVVYGPR